MTEDRLKETTTSVSRLLDIEARLNAATPGPWVNNPRGVVKSQSRIIFWDDEPNSGDKTDDIQPDYEFIVRKLKAWREEAQPERKQIQCPDGKKGCLVMHFSQDLFDTPEKQTIRKLIDALLIYEDAMDSILGQMELVNDHPIEVVLKAREANAKVEELFK
jgi:hypothetical protein